MKTEHYFTQNPTSELKTRTIRAILRGNVLEFQTASGMFSPDKIDNGTQLLVDECKMEERWRVLDIGCGYGAVGIAIAKAYPMNPVVMSDVNERAVEFAKRNAKKNGVNVIIFQGDGYAAVKNELFNAILLNPPQSAGKKLCIELITHAKEHLLKDGWLQIVARHHKGGRPLAEKMQEIFGNLEVIGRGSGFKIYASQNS